MTVAKLLASLPASVRVGPFDFRLIKASQAQCTSRNEWGSFHSATQEVVLQDAFPTAAKAADTFLHELGHAIYWAYGLQDDDKEERIVSTMATAWVQVYRDNPWLLKWLAKATA